MTWSVLKYTFHKYNVKKPFLFILSLFLGYLLPRNGREYPSTLIEVADTACNRRSCTIWLSLNTSGKRGREMWAIMMSSRSLSIMICVIRVFYSSSSIFQKVKLPKLEQRDAQLQNEDKSIILTNRNDDATIQRSHTYLALVHY